MGYEKPESKSVDYGFHEEWESLELISEITLLPLEILSKFMEDSFGQHT